MFLQRPAKLSQAEKEEKKKIFDKEKGHGKQATG
jgi:hypothetical protein